MKRLAPLLLTLSWALVACPPKQPAEVGPVADEATTPGQADDGLATAAPATAETDEERLDRVLREASEAVASGDAARLRKSVEDLKAASAMAPDRAEIPYNVGVVYEAMGDDTNARKSYLRATDVDPTLGEAWLNLGAMAEEQGDYARALQGYEAGLRYAPEHPGLVVGVIGVLRKQGKYAQAVERAKQALGQNSNNIDAYNNLGLVYLDQGQVDLASFVYQKALNSIEGADQNAMLHCNLGRVYLARDQAFLARQELQRALDLDPKLVAAMMFLADLHLDDRNWTDAAAMLERARVIEPQNTAILVNLGIAYRGLGRFEEAQSLYQQALDLDPGNPDPYLNLAVLQGDHMRAYDAALASIDRYLAAGGARTALAEQWRTELAASKDKYERELDRKRKREEREKQRAEEEQLARQHEENQRRAREVAAAAIGKPCPADGCPELTACNREQVCVDVGSPGTAVEGDACQADADCTFGLLCGPEGTCMPGAAVPAVPAGTPTDAPAPVPTDTPAPAPTDAPAPADAPPAEAPGATPAPEPQPATGDGSSPWGGE